MSSRSLRVALASIAGVIAILSFYLFMTQNPGDLQPVSREQDFENLPGFLEVRPGDWLTDATRVRGRFLTNLRLDDERWVRFKGTISTGAFQPSLFMMLPINGPSYADGSRFRPGDASIAVVCVRDGRSRELLRAGTSEWFERLFVIPSSWCRGRVRVIATALVDGVEIGVGTPFRASFSYWLTASPPGTVAAAAIALIFVSVMVAPISFL